MIDGVETATMEVAAPAAGGDAAPRSSGPEGRAGRSDETPHAFLRRVTRPWHDGVERAFERFDLHTPDGLGGFLLGQAAAVIPLEQALEQADVEAWMPDWVARRRTASLLADLARLGLPPSRTPARPTLPTRCHALGVLYVIEGSKLGGRLLHRRVLASPDARVRATDAFLGHRHDRGWPSFLAVLNVLQPEPEAFAALREGARIAFAAFHTAASQDLSIPFGPATTRSSLTLQAHARSMRAKPDTEKAES